jgi:hypothetical protein
MTEIRPVTACPDCGLFWAAASEPSCTVAEHVSRHRRFELHVHRSAVTLPDGTEVWAVSFDAASPYERVSRPDYGLYLDRRWQPPWPHDHLDWPDFGVPPDPEEVLAALRSLHNRARTGERVELGCLGGHGRTGTALACLVVMAGVPPADAVAWVRANYCHQAVETEDQATFVTGLKPA